MPHIFGATNYLEEWLAPVLAGPHQAAATHALSSGPGSASMEWMLMGFSVGLVLVSIYLAYYLYNKNLNATTKLREKLSGVHKLLLNKYWVDEAYGAMIIRPLIYGSVFLWKFVDVVIIDGLVNGLARVAGDASDLLRYTQSGRVRNYATIFLTGVVAIVAYFIFG